MVAVCEVPTFLPQQEPCAGSAQARRKRTPTITMAISSVLVGGERRATARPTSGSADNSTA